MTLASRLERSVVAELERRRADAGRAGRRRRRRVPAWRGTQVAIPAAAVGRDRRNDGRGSPVGRRRRAVMPEKRGERGVA